MGRGPRHWGAVAKEPLDVSTEEKYKTFSVAHFSDFLANPGDTCK